MELKALSDELKEILGIDDIGEMPGRIEAMLFSDQREAIFDQYVSLVPDLSQDYLQRVYQFWLADREDKKQDFTPTSIARLLARLTALESGVVYDCCAGSGALTIAQWSDNPNLRFYCEEIDANVIPVLLFNLAIRNIGAWVVNKDVLTGDIYACYQVVPGQRYAEVKREIGPPDLACDAAISNPPYNIPWDGIADEIFPKDAPLPPASLANYVFVASCLYRSRGRTAIVLPSGVLTSAPERDYRRWLIEQDMVEAVIWLPERMFESTSIPTVVLLLNQSKERAGTVAMIDATSLAMQETREQRGEDYARARVYKKQVNVLPDSSIAEIMNMVANPANEAGLCAVATTEQIAEFDYSLATNRYIEMEQQTSTHRPYQDIVRDLRFVIEERNVVKLTMNENVAKSLGFYELFDMHRQSNEVQQMMNDLMEKLKIPGFPLPKSDWFTVTKNKNELKVENKSKESISSIFLTLLPMYRQHLYFLNEMESRLLAELRDALLPELMSGEIAVGQEG